MSEMWNSVAPSWEANAGFIDAMLADATAVLLDAADIKDAATVLELGAGPGGAGLAAAERVGPDGSVVLSDVAEEMVTVAGARAGADPRITTAVFDQSDIPLGDEGLDAVICRHGLMFAEDPGASLAEAARVLRPGGRYATMTWSRRELNPWLGLVLDAVGDQFGVPFPPPSVRGPFSLDSADALRSLLESAGLEDVTVQTVATPMRAASLAEWWGRVPQLAGPLAMALAGMEPSVRTAIGDRATQAGSAAATTNEDGVVFAGSVLIASGRKPTAPSFG